MTRVGSQRHRKKKVDLFEKLAVKKVFFKKGLFFIAMAI
jgi:hypothetical protein